MSPGCIYIIETGMDNTFDEQDLIAGCKRGDSQARRRLYEQYAPAMLSVCTRYAGDRETARDLLQEGFIKVFTKIGGYSGSGSFSGWMRRVFVTTALEYLRQNDALKLSVSIDECGDRMDEESHSALESLSADELLKCIAALPDGYRTIFNLYAIEGYSHAEIARMMHIKESSSRSQFGRARQMLQKKILQYRAE